MTNVLCGFLLYFRLKGLLDTTRCTGGFSTPVQFFLSFTNHIQSLDVVHCQQTDWPELTLVEHSSIFFSSALTIECSFTYVCVRLVPSICEDIGDKVGVKNFLGTRACKLSQQSRRQRASLVTDRSHDAGEAPLCAEEPVTVQATLIVQVALQHVHSDHVGVHGVGILPHGGLDH